MKPHISYKMGTWRCVAGWIQGFGRTPKEAYKACANIRDRTIRIFGEFSDGRCL